MKTVRNMLLSKSFAAVTLFTASSAFSQTTLPTSPYLPLDMAQTAARAALDACAADGKAVSVAIVDRSGVSKILLKADGSGPVTNTASTGKALAAAHFGRDTAGLAEFISKNPQNNGLRDLDPRLVIQAGGLPIKIGEALVGGIGVGGAPSGDIDTACALAGLKAIGAE